MRTHLKIAEAMEAEVLDREDTHVRAFDTPFSYSKAHGCERALGYRIAGYEQTDPIDGPGLIIADMGTDAHTRIQKAVADIYPDARFETASVIEDIIHGHVDIDLPEDDEVVEIKTVGAYAFDKAIGIVRAPGRGRPAYWKDRGGDGPSLPHIIQGGFNARGLGRSKVRIVYISREAVSVQKAEQLAMTTMQRIAAEWVFTEDQWWPLVENELNRMRGIRAKVAWGMLPDRVRPDNNGVAELISPDKHPLCRYCPYETQCREDGPGTIPLLEAM